MTYSDWSETEVPNWLWILLFVAARAGKWQLKINDILLTVLVPLVPPPPLRLLLFQPLIDPCRTDKVIILLSTSADTVQFFFHCTILD